MSAHLPGLARRQLEVTIGGCSSAGVKTVNDDAFAAWQPDPAQRALKGVALCIADGAGCSDNAQLASQTAVRTFIEDYYSTPDSWPVRVAAARVLSALNAWLFHHGRQQVAHNALVTTFSAVVLKSTTAHLLHAGDSRIYRLRGGQLQQLTRDHLQRQGDGAQFLTRALGMDDRLEVDYLPEEIEAGDLLALTTDGVHSVLSDAALGELLGAGDGDLEQRAQAVVEAARSAGSDDNLSCLLVRIEALPVEDLDEVHSRLTQLVIPPALETGQVIDGFRVERVLHNGTRSQVYLARREIDGERVVLKAPSPDFADDPQYLEGFMREQWVGRRIDHPGLMRIFPRPATSPFLYHVCEYVDGQTLRQWGFDHPRPALATVRALAGGIVTALRVLQRQHMVHRDLKPENIMVLADGDIKLIDFGTVQVGGLGELYSPLREEGPVGAADYTAPECVQGEGATHLADLFALAAIVYELLTGVLPFGPMPADVRPGRQPVRRYRSARERRPDLPLWVDLALQRALSPNPRLRQQAFSEFLQDLTEPNREALRRHRSAPLIERSPVSFWRGVALLLLLVVLIQALLLVRG